jgi:P22 coat protein - gene protein 5
MADIKLTTADAAGFIPQYWANKALDLLRSQIVLAQLVARDTDFTDGFGWKGKSITIPYAGNFTAVDKVADTPVTPQAPVNGGSTTLTLNRHKVVPFLVEDFARAQANPELMDRYMEPAVVALVEQFETDLFVAAMGIGGATAGAIGTPGTNVAAASLQSATVNLNNLKAPAADRSVILSPKDEMSILADTTIATYFAFSESDSIKNGYFGRLYGLNAFMSQLVPTGVRVTLGAPTAGTFTLTVGGQTTGGIAFNATAATVQAAVAALTSVNAGFVTVAGLAGGPYSLVLTGTAAGQTVTGSGTGLTGGTFAVAAAVKNLALHKNSVIFATREFEPPPAGSGVYSASANDPVSGLSIRISSQYDINNIGQRVNLDMLYGAIPLRATQGVLIDA